MAEPTLLERELADTAHSPYLRRLGLRVLDASDGEAAVLMSFVPTLVNRAGSVHGGAISSLLLVGASLASASSQRGAAAVRGRPLSISVSFLTAPRGQSVAVKARVRHRGRDTVHVGADVEADDGSAVASATLVHRVYPADCGASEPNEVGGVEAAAAKQLSAAQGKAPAGSAYLRAAGLEVVGDKLPWTCARLPLEPNQGLPGCVHEGAMVALADSCGAFCAYAHAGVGRDRPGATVSIQMSFALRRAGAVAGAGRLLARNGCCLSSEVQLWHPPSAQLTASALVSYRIPG